MSRLIVAAIGCLLLWSGSLHAQETIGHRLLERRSAVLTITGDGAAATCLGFRLTPNDFPPNVDLVLTAAHCLYDLGESPAVTVQSLARHSGRSRAAYMWTELDLTLLLVTPRLGPLEPLRYAHTGAPADLPVLAMVRGSGGAPSITSARVLGQEEHIVYLGMPAAPGSSGGGVVDPSAFLVGMISSGTPVVRGTTATPFVMAIGANAIFGLWDHERERILARARELNR
ncbi:MAG: S1 family peptidase [Armatimonadota bacterium]